MGLLWQRKLISINSVLVVAIKIYISILDCNLTRTLTANTGNNLKENIIMLTLSKARQALIINNDKLINAKELLKEMENDPAAHFEDEMKAAYNEMLNEEYAAQFEAFPFALGEPCDWIEENQPIDYRVGFSDFEFDPSYCDEYTNLEAEIEELENEIYGLEEEIEELEAEEE